jgi:hypothetical protein
MRRDLRAKKERRRVLSFRVSPEIHQRLEEASRASGRSVAQEAELRIEQALRDERGFRENLDFAFGRQGAAVAEMTGFLMRARGDDWANDANAYADVKRQVDTIFAAIKPPGEPTERILDAGLEAVSLLGKLFSVAPNAAFFRWSYELRERLGSAAIHRIMKWLASVKVSS